MWKKLLLLIPILAVTLVRPVNATELNKAWATAYCLTGTTATGTQTTEGRTVASKREYFGSTMIIWADDGDGLIKPENYIGTFIVEDTGGRTIKNGSVIDIYIADYDRAMQFGSKRIIYIVIPAEG